MSIPFLTTVIPTHARPKYLPLAVRSAINASNNSEDIEVIVVPNGSDRSWMSSMSSFSLDHRIHIEPIEIANANAARNHGLRLARGKYVRFLDDDDLLLPGASIYQCELLESEDTDICSGTIDLVDSFGEPFRTWPQPETDDFVEAVLAPTRVTHLAAYVYRTAALSKQKWQESVPLGQDTQWAHQLCQSNEWPWTRTAEKVGQWRHHEGVRISSSARQLRHLKVSVGYLRETIAALTQTGRWNKNRKAAAAAGLWSYVHAGFFLEPTYWGAIAREVQRLFPGTYPDICLYRHTWGRLIPPLILETVMLPKRKLNHAVRRWSFKRGKLNSAVPP